MKMKFATIILFLTAFAAFFLALPLQGGTPGAEVKPLSEAILKHGMEDGAIRMMPCPNCAVLEKKRIG